MNRRTATVVALGVFALLALGTTAWTLQSEPPAPEASATSEADESPAPKPPSTIAKVPSPRERWLAKRAGIRGALARRPSPVVDSVVVLDDTIGAEDFGECIVESAPLAELADPGEAVADAFVFRYTASPRPDNAVDFLTDHPEIAQVHPRLVALLDRPPGAPPSDENATAFAQTISTDPEAGQQFMQWMTEQGVDLSAVRVGP